MTNGTRPAVLLSDLLSGDGPYSRAADEFLASVCRRCGGPIEPRGLLSEEGALCALCAARRAAHLIR